MKNFPEFYEKWVGKMEEILQQLVEVSKNGSSREEEVHASLVSTVTSHMKEYYTVKWAAAREDVLVLFSPSWVSPLENAYQWVTGWKPSRVFRLVESMKRSKVFVMTEEQARRVEELRVRIRMEEEKVEREMERQQVAMADRNIVQLIKLTCDRERNNDDNNNNGAFKWVLARLERLVKASDCVRLNTLKGLLDILTPIQCVHFLAANIAMHLRLTHSGNNTMPPASIPSTKETLYHH